MLKSNCSSPDSGTFKAESNTLTAPLRPLLIDITTACQNEQTETDRQIDKLYIRIYHAQHYDR